MVLQDVFLFNGSVRENILFGRPTATSIVASVLFDSDATAVLGALCIGLLASLVTRTPLKVEVVRDRLTRDTGRSEYTFDTFMMGQQRKKAL